MSKQNQKIRKQASLIEAVSGALLISLPTMFVANVALAMPWMQSKQLTQTSPSPDTTPSAKPRPSIFNEAPYNRQQRTSPTDSNIPQTKPGDTIQPPLPESQQPPSVTVTPVDGKIYIRLVNTTKSVVNYQVIGDTNQRILKGNSDVTLQNIRTPVTLTFGREDKGLLRVNAQASTSGLLEVSLDESTNFDEDKSTLVIQHSGAVFVN